MSNFKSIYFKLSFIPILGILFSCNKLPDERIIEIDNVITHISSKNLFNGNILVAENGKILLHKSYGLANYDTEDPLKKETIFDIGSISKTFTAMAVLKLEEQGLLKIEDSVVKYLPELPYNNITIHQLLSHTSGVPEEQFRAKGIIQELTGRAFTNEQIKDVLVKLKPELDFIPGTQYAYSNTNYTLLALIFEKVSGMLLPNYLKKEIFEPLNMTNTFFSRNSIPAEKQSNLSKRFIKQKFLNPIYKSTDSLEAKEDLTWKNKYGGDKIHSTTEDLFKYHNALQDGKLLSIESLSKMYNPFKLADAKEYTYSNYPSYSGSSWRVAKNEINGKIVHHAGGVPGGRTIMMRNITKNQVVIILTNNEETNRWTFTFPMRVLNHEPYKLDDIRLDNLFANEYIKNGFAAALHKYDSLNGLENYKPIGEWEFEDIGSELLRIGKPLEAIEFFKRYTINHGDKDYSWYYLGEAYEIAKDTNNAITAYKKALELKPKDNEYKLLIKNLIKN